MVGGRRRAARRADGLPPLPPLRIRRGSAACELADALEGFRIFALELLGGDLDVGKQGSGLPGAAQARQCVGEVEADHGIVRADAKGAVEGGNGFVEVAFGGENLPVGVVQFVDVVAQREGAADERFGGIQLAEAEAHVGEVAEREGRFPAVTGGLQVFLRGRPVVRLCGEGAEDVVGERVGGVDAQEGMRRLARGTRVFERVIQEQDGAQQVGRARGDLLGQAELGAGFRIALVEQVERAHRNGALVVARTRIPAQARRQGGEFVLDFLPRGFVFFLGEGDDACGEERQQGFGILGIFREAGVEGFAGLLGLPAGEQEVGFLAEQERFVAGDALEMREEFLGFPEAFLAQPGMVQSECGGDAVGVGVERLGKIIFRGGQIAGAAANAGNGKEERRAVGGGGVFPAFRILQG